MIKYENMQSFISQIQSHQFTSSSRARIALELHSLFEMSFSKKRVLKLLSGTLFIRSVFQKKETIGPTRLFLLSLSKSSLAFPLQARIPSLEPALEESQPLMERSPVSKIIFNEWGQCSKTARRSFEVK